MFRLLPSILLSLELSGSMCCVIFRGVVKIKYHGYQFLFVVRGRSYLGRQLTSLFLGGIQFQILEMTLLAILTDSATFLCVFQDCNIALIHQATNSGKWHYSEILKSFFLKKNSKEVRLSKERLKKISFCKIGISTHIFFLVSNIMNVDLHMKFFILFSAAL